MIFWIGSAFLVCTILFAVIFGSSPERLGGLALFAMAAITLIARSMFPRVFSVMDPVSMIVDLIGLLAFGAIALSSKRFWPLWATSFQLLSLSAHLVRLLDINAGMLTYSIMKTAPSFLIMISLIVGTANHLRRKDDRSSTNYWRAW